MQKKHRPLSVAGLYDWQIWKIKLEKNAYQNMGYSR